MEDDTFIHFEFQTTNKGKVDLRRFRAYEAVLSHQTGKKDKKEKALAKVKALIKEFNFS